MGSGKPPLRQRARWDPPVQYPGRHGTDVAAALAVEMHQSRSPAAGGHHGPWVWSLIALARNADRLPAGAGGEVVALLIRHRDARSRDHVAEVLTTAVSVSVGLLLALVLGVDLAPEVTLIDDDSVPAPEVVGVPDVVVVGFDWLSALSAGVVAGVSDWLAAGVVVEPDGVLDLNGELDDNTLAVNAFGVNALGVSWAGGVLLGAGGSSEPDKRDAAVANGSWVGGGVGRVPSISPIASLMPWRVAATRLTPRVIGLMIGIRWKGVGVP